MQIFNLGSFPKNHAFSDYELQPLNHEDDRKKFESTGAQAAFYWYSQGDYDGQGKCLFVKDNKWYLKDLGHCSCYGPLDDGGDSLTLVEPWLNNLDEAKDKCSEELWTNEIEPLVNLAIVNGFDQNRKKSKEKFAWLFGDE